MRLMSNPAETKGDPGLLAITHKGRFLDAKARRLTGWCGIGLVVAILVNGPLSQALQRTPSYWDADAAGKTAAYLQDGSNVDQMVVFFALSNLIFVFGIGFFAGLRRVSNGSGVSDW